MKTLMIKKYQTSFFQCFDCLMIILGTVGVVGGLIHSLYFPPQSIFAVGLLSLLGIFLYFQFYKGIIWIRHQLLGCFVLLLFICFLLFFTSIQGVIDQLITTIQYDYFLEFHIIFQNVHELNSILPIIFAFLLGIPILYLIISLICQRHRSLIKICILLFLFFFPLFIRHTLERYTSYCFILFILYQFVFSWILQYQKGQLMLRGLLLVVLSIGLFFSSLFLEPNPIFNQSSTSVLSQINHWIDNGAFDSLFHNQNVTGTSSSVDGSLPTNSVQTNQGIAMTVKASTPFSSYIRGYSLAYYENNKWHSVETASKNSTSLIDYTNYLKSVGSYKEQSVEIETTKNTEYQFVPYFPSFQREIINDSYYQKFTGIMNILIDDSTQVRFKDKLYHQYSYEDYVRQEYLKIPPELEDDLKIFLNEHGIEGSAYNGELLTDYKDDIEQVKRVLFKEAKYDLDAGALPANTDFVRYFLFENHRGSCTHFSTTGALLLRCLGIPTRYVRGYILKESDFEDGVATIRNYRSHAWVEVYESGKGWVPYEMTPSDGESNLNEVGTMLDRIVNNERPRSSQQTNPNTPEEETTSTTNTTTNEGEGKTVKTVPWYQNLLKYQDVMITLGIIFITISSYRFITKYWLSLRLKRYDNNKKVILYYHRMMKILKFGGAADPTIVDMANKAQFSQHRIQDDELTQVDEVYHNFVNDVYKDLPFYKKLIFQYVFGYK